MAASPDGELASTVVVQLPSRVEAHAMSGVAVDAEGTVAVVTYASTDEQDFLGRRIEWFSSDGRSQRVLDVPGVADLQLSAGRSAGRWLMISELPSNACPDFELDVIGGAEDTVYFGGLPTRIACELVANDEARVAWRIIYDDEQRGTARKYDLRGNEIGGGFVALGQPEGVTRSGELIMRHYTTIASYDGDGLRWSVDSLGVAMGEVYADADGTADIAELQPGSPPTALITHVDADGTVGPTLSWEGGGGEGEPIVLAAGDELRWAIDDTGLVALIDDGVELVTATELDALGTDHFVDATGPFLAIANAPQEWDPYSIFLVRR